MPYPAIRVYSKPRLRVAPTPPASFSARGGGLTASGILALSPAVWFRLGIGITIATGVSQWDDQSGNGRHLKQATGGSQPLVQGDNSILFDGVDDYLKCDTFTLAQPETIYLLFKQVTWTLNDGICDGNTLNAAKVFQSSVTPGLRLGGTAFTVIDNTNPLLNAYMVAVAQFNAATSFLQINSLAPTTGDVGTGTMSGFTLGAMGDNLNPSNIQVKEAMVFPVLHDAITRARIIAYLNKVGSL